MSNMRDTMGRFRTLSLFWEYRQPKYEYYWSCADEDITKDGIIIPSMRKIYMSYYHIPEYEYQFAQDMFGSWEHWLALQDNGALMSRIERWRQELDVMNRAYEIKNLISASRVDKSLGASKYLETKLTPAKRGRPSKAEKAGALQIATKNNTTISNMSSRVTDLLQRKKETK